jgi:hypothetical protein
VLQVLALVLSRRFLKLTVGHIEVRTAEARSQPERVRRRRLEDEADVALVGRSAIVEILRMHGVEETVRALARRVERQHGVPTERPDEATAAAPGSLAARTGLERTGPAGGGLGGCPDLDHAAGLEPELGREVAGHDVHGRDEGGLGRDAVEHIEPLVDGDAIDHV